MCLLYDDAIKDFCLTLPSCTSSLLSFNFPLTLGKDFIASEFHQLFTPAALVASKFTRARAHPHVLAHI